MRLSPAHSIRSCPANGEPFEIVFYGDYKDNQPLALVRHAHGDSKGWTYVGSPIEGRKIFSCTLISLDATLTLDKVRDKLACHGGLPPGQLMSGFKAAFSKPDGKGPIGMVDATWVAPDGHFNFPHIGRGGDLGFRRAAGTFGPIWRWIITV